MPRNILVVGRPGSGKRTYAAARSRDEAGTAVCIRESFLEAPLYIHWDEYVFLGRNISTQFLYGSGLSAIEKVRISTVSELKDLRRSPDY